MRTRARSRTLERAMTLPNIPESISPDQQGAEQISPSQAPHIRYDVIEHHDTGVEPVVPVTVVAST